VVTIPTFPFRRLKQYPNWVKLEEAFREIEEIVGADVFKRLEPIYNKIINETIKPLVKTSPSEVDTIFKAKCPLFTNYFMSVLSSINISLILSKTESELRGSLKLVKEIEKRIYRVFKDIIEKSEFNGKEDVLYAFSILTDYDLWVINTLLEFGFEEYVHRVEERARYEIRELMSYLFSLTYSLMACLSVILRVVEEPVVETFNVLVNWCKRYAGDVDSYVDTIDLLISDEHYEVIKDYIEM